MNASGSVTGVGLTNVYKKTLTRTQVPQAPDVSFRPLLFSTSQGYFVNILRVKRSGILSRHQHTGPVHATTLKGRWHYLEHDWWAEEGGYSFEPPGETHTLEVPEGCEYMATLFHVTGAYIVSYAIPSIHVVVLQRSNFRPAG
jgi:hypothetical protein